MREFITAAKAVEEPTGVVEFKIDGQVLRAYPPTDGQLAIFMTSMGRHSSNNTRVAGAMDFFLSVLDDESHGYMAERMLSRRESEELLDKIIEIMRYLVEEWTGRPTPPLSGSTQSQESGGPNSAPTMSTSISSEPVPTYT